MNKVLLNDVCEMHGRVGWKGYTVEDLTDEGPLVLGANEITADNQLDLTGVKHLTREKYEESPEIFVKKDDILVVKVGSTIGKVGIVNRDLGEASINPNCVILRAKSINPYYLYYYMCSPAGKAYLINNSAASGQPALNQATLKKMEVPVVDSLKQEAIAGLLNSINEKIANNTAICTDLESMAKLLYDYWFVQFDFPNENGKPYKSSGGKMVWNEELKREMPEGWSVVTFGECITSINTGLNPRDNFKLNTGGSIKYLTVKNLTAYGTIDFNSCDTIDEEARAIVHRRSDIKVGDILFASISPLGRCSIINEEPENWDINESVFSIRPKYENMTSVFLYMTFMSDAFVKKAEGSSAGSVFKGIRISELQGLTTILPPKHVLDAFDQRVKQLFSMKSTSFIENQQLASLRDFLLPMLMNGQVKVGKVGADA